MVRPFFRAAVRARAGRRAARERRVRLRQGRVPHGAALWLLRELARVRARQRGRRLLRQLRRRPAALRLERAEHQRAAAAAAAGAVQRLALVRALRRARAVRLVHGRRRGRGALPAGDGHGTGRVRRRPLPAVRQRAVRGGGLDPACRASLAGQLRGLGTGHNFSRSERGFRVGGVQPVFFTCYT